MLGFGGLVTAGYLLSQEIRRTPSAHPDNNKFLGKDTTSQSKTGFRAKISNGENVLTGPEIIRINVTINSGEDILSSQFGGFRGGSGIHLKGRERFLGIPYGTPMLTVQDSENGVINYKLPPLKPGLAFHIFNELKKYSALVVVIGYSHPEIALEIAQLVSRRQEPELKFAPVRP